MCTSQSQLSFCLELSSIYRHADFQHYKPTKLDAVRGASTAHDQGVQQYDAWSVSCEATKKCANFVGLAMHRGDFQGLFPDIIELEQVIEDFI